ADIDVNGEESAHITRKERAPGNLASLMQQSERLCPICPKKRELIVCMDGNFGLVCKENSGRSFDPPILAGSLFIDDEDVQRHIKRALRDKQSKYKAVSTSMSIIQILHKQSNFRTAANLKPEVACVLRKPRLSWMLQEYLERYAVTKFP
uniref:Uncharacterized protein n=1 Tax=Capitella teleta TaxID=283909 RepID=X1ZM16_CAPTE